MVQAVPRGLPLLVEVVVVVDELVVDEVVPVVVLVEFVVVPPVLVAPPEPMPNVSRKHPLGAARSPAAKSTASAPAPRGVRHACLCAAVCQAIAALALSGTG